MASSSFFCFSVELYVGSVLMISFKLDDVSNGISVLRKLLSRNQPERRADKSLSSAKKDLEIVKLQHLEHSTVTM